MVLEEVVTEVFWGQTRRSDQYLKRVVSKLTAAIEHLKDLPSDQILPEGLSLFHCFFKFFSSTNVVLPRLVVSKGAFHIHQEQWTDAV